MTEDVIELMPRQRAAAAQPVSDLLAAPAVLVADSEPLVCRIVAEALTSRGQLCVVGQATAAAEVLGRASRDSTVIVDPFSFDTDALALVKHLCARGTRAVVWTHWQSLRDPIACLQAGAQGVLSKAGDLAGLQQAVLAVLAGHVVMDPSITAELASACTASHTAGSPPQIGCLTPTERAVFHLLEAGATTTTMSRELRMTPATVRSHISHALQKLGLENRAQAVGLGQALRHGPVNHVAMSTDVAPSL